MPTNVQLAKKETVDIVAEKIKGFQNSGELHFPLDYSPENALKSAWLILQSTVDRNSKPVLQVCTRDSIANALLSMVIQGLNPDKKQCYFIAYGSALTMQRSYFGSIAVAKRVDPDIVDVYPDVVYEGDIFKYSKKHGVTTITTHEQELKNVNKKNIVAAYATVLYKDGREVSTIMTLEDIKQAWRQSQMHPIDENGAIKVGSTHEKFTAEMCQKTVVNRACKAIINSSDDSSLVIRYAKKTSDTAVEAEAAQEIADNANTEAIDVECENVPETDPGTGEVIDTDEGQTTMQEVAPAPSPAPEAHTKGNKSAKQDDPY